MIILRLRAAGLPATVLFFLAVCATGNVKSQCPDGTPPPCRAAAARRVAVPGNSVAVAYFTTPDSADAYMADGLTEDIATTLSQSGAVTVKATGSVRRAQRQYADDLRGMGRALGVRYVVSGSVRRIGARYRVAVRLVEAAEEVTRWGETYDRDGAALPDLPVAVSGAIASAMVGARARPAAAARRTSDPVAYDHYLRGNFLTARRTPASVAAAVREYATAVARDSTFAGGYASLAWDYSVIGWWGWDLGMPKDSVIAWGLASAEHALRLDTANAMAWAAISSLRETEDPRRLTGAIEAGERSVALDPGSAAAWHSYGVTLRDYGRDSDADVAFHRALSLEPDRAITLHNLMLSALVRRRNDEALRWADSALSVDPEFFWSLSFRALIYARNGRGAEARRDLDAMRRIIPDFAYLVEALEVAVAAAARDTAAARAHATVMTAALQPHATPTAIDGLLVVPAYAAVGDTSQALAYLESVRPRGGILWALSRVEGFDPLRGSARFQRVIADSRPPGATGP